MHTRYLEATDRKQASLKNISITSISKDMEAHGDVRISAQYLEIKIDRISPLILCIHTGKI